MTEEQKKRYEKAKKNARFFGFMTDFCAFTSAFGIGYADGIGIPLDDIILRELVFYGLPSARGILIGISSIKTHKVLINAFNTDKPGLEKYIESLDEDERKEVRATVKEAVKLSPGCAAVLMGVKEAAITELEIFAGYMSGYCVAKVFN